MGGLSNYREIGKFDVLVAPRNPIGAFDAEQFKKDALELFEKGSQNIVVDLDNLDFLYSDAFNAFSLIHQKLVTRSGTLGILASDDLAVKSLQQAGVDRYVKVFRTEPEIMVASLKSNAPPAPVAEPNVSPAFVHEPPTSPAEPSHRRTHKFTQSFNSSLSDQHDGIDKAILKGIPNEFEDALTQGSSRKSGLVIGILIGVLIVGAAITFILMR